MRARLSPSGVPAAALTALLAASGMFTVNVMPVLVTGLQTALHFTVREAGLVASANSYGTAAGALIAVLFGRHLAWRRTAAIGLSVMIVLDLLSNLCGTLPALLAVRAVQGCVGGIVTALTFAVIARAAVPDRVFGLLLLIQFLLGGLGVAILPGLIQHHGIVVLFGSLAGFAALVLLLLPVIPDQPHKCPAATPGPVPALEPATVRERRVRSWCAFAALFLFQTSHTTCGAFILDIAKAAGLTIAAASASAGIAGMSGIAGAIMVSVIGLRYGRLRPLMIAMTVAAASLLILLTSFNLAGFTLAILIGSVSWTFAVPLLLGQCASPDTPAGARCGAVSSRSSASRPDR